MSKNATIVRRPDFAGGGLTEEECRRMAEHVALWTRRAFRTEPIDRAEITRAILDLYDAAGLKAPRVVIVPSPLVMAVAGSFAAAIWYARKNGGALPRRYAATYEATRAATRAATDEATREATDAATREATRAARPRPGWARQLANEIAPELADLMLACVPLWYRPYQGGNMWAAWECYLTSARDILGLRLPAHGKYDAWERAAVHGGFRYMHEEFCMVSDFPAVLKVNAQNQPHCDGGPSHLWRDGWALYHLNGVKVTREIAETPAAELDPRLILKEQNAEVRREIVRKVGVERVCDSLGARCIDREGDYELLLLDLDDRRSRPHLKMLNPSIGVYHIEGVHPDCKTVRQALAWRNSLDSYQEPQILT